MKYSEQDLQRIISDVENDFKKSLSKAENATETEVTLTKSEECDYDENDHEELSSIYKNMSKAEAEAHFLALAKNWDIEVEKEESMTKSENEELSLVKSEAALLKSENEGLKKSIEDLVNALKANVNQAPARKAITNIEYIAKTEQAPKVEAKTYTRQEALKKLKTVAQEKALTKSEEDAIIEFTLDNSISTDKIKHLL